MRVPFVVIAALMPAVVLAAPAGKPQTSIAGFTRGAPVPKWASPLADIPRTERTDPVVTRLNETQGLVGAAPATLYNRAIQVNDSSALGVIGQYAINYFAQYQKLALHRVVILRGNERLDRTASVSIRPLQRETDIESGMMGGATTVQLLLDDVRIGDTLWITYTIDGENPVLGKRWSGNFTWDGAGPIELRRVTVLHPRNRPLSWRQLGDFHTEQLAPQIDQVGDMQRIRFEGRALEPVEGEPSVPPEYLSARMLQLTEYEDWNGVARWAEGLFPKVEASTALKALAKQFAGAGNAEARAGAALHWVQNEIRYFSVSIGENSHRPQPPDAVLKRRYGDCKDKSYLLVSLLRELGVEAQLVLLSAEAPKLAPKLLPTPVWFDHVIVQISIDGRDYYVDPTRTNQPEPLSAMPIAFPGGAVLRVGAATQGLSAIPERSEALPTFEHTEEIVIADFSGAATLVTRDIYRSTYADAMRGYFTRMSVNEQKKSVQAKYEKLYPGVSLEGAPVYQDVVADNRVEVTSRYKLPKAVSLKDKRYQITFSSQVVEGSLGIPSKLVRNFPFQPSGGLYSGRYRLRIQWPANVRRNDAPSGKLVDNPYFQLREEYALRGNEVDYMIDYRLKQRTIPAAELPALEEQSKLLNEFVEGTLRIEETAVMPADMLSYSMRDLKSLRDTGLVLDAESRLAAKKDGEIALADACGYLDGRQDLYQFLGVEGATLAQRLEKLVAAAKPQAGLGACKARLAFAAGKYPEGVAALAADPPGDATDPLMRELAWVQLRGGDTAAALATMARYRAAREQAASGMIDVGDAASHIALLQRSGQPLPAELDQFARAVPDGPWPRPVLAMQVGLLSAEQLLKRVDALGADARALALNDAWFYIGQARLAAKDDEGAERAFRWLNSHGLRNDARTRAARAETRALYERDRYGGPAIKALRNDDLVTAIGAFREGAQAGNAASRYALGMALLRGQGTAKSPEQAYEWFRLAADQGHPDAQAMVGSMLMYGTGTAKDVDRGLVWLRRAAEQDAPAAQYELGHRYRWGYGVDRDFEQALRWLPQAADQDHGGAMADLAAMYRHAEGVPRDYGQAEFWYRRGALLGDGTAMYGLGTAYEYGESVERDYAKAAVLYRGAFKLGNADGAVNLGLLHEKGNGVAQDYRAAADLYRQASELGNHYGTRNLAVLHLNGRGVARDPRLAADLNRKAVEQGSVDALTGLGYQYEKGLGVPQDYAQARAWYEKAAERRESLAEFNLANMYDAGLGVERDRTKAMQWYRRSAEDGDRDAQYWLGQGLFIGVGVKRDRLEAAEWYAKSAAQGLDTAQAMLGQMYFFGWGVTPDLSKAVALLRQAAEQGHELASFRLGQAYEQGRGVAPDVAQAIAWYQKAGGVLAAKVKLGTLYLGAGNDETKGRRLLAEADNQSTPAGYADLAQAYVAADNKGKAEWAYLRGLDLAERDGGNDAGLYDALTDAEAYYEDNYQYEKAAPLMARRVRLAEKTMAERLPALADVLESQGDLYQRRGRYQDAETVYQRVLSMREAAHGAGSVEVAAMLDSIGGLYLEADRYDEATDFTRRALAIYEAKNDDRAAAAWRHLGAVMLATADYAEADNALQRALAMLEKRHGRDSSMLTGTLNNLGAMYTKMRQHDKAGATIERAIKLAGHSSPGSSLSIPVYQMNLAIVRTGEKRYAEAEALLLESQASKALLLGADHAEMSFGLHALGRLYKSQQRYAEALPHLQRAFALREQDGTYSGRLMAEVLQDLGDVYLELGQYAQAEPLLSRALTLRSAIQREQHPELTETRRSLAELRRKAGRA